LQSQQQQQQVPVSGDGIGIITLMSASVDRRAHVVRPQRETPRPAGWSGAQIFAAAAAAAAAAVNHRERQNVCRD
jgi:hypothetical protein